MRSKMMAAMVASMALLVAAPAFAQGEHGGKGGEKSERPSFPMPAAAFQQRVDARQAKMRARVEQRAAKLSAAEAKELRARFEANVAKINAEVAKAVADGTVTKDEAAAVRAASPHHGKGGGAHRDHAKGKSAA